MARKFQRSNQIKMIGFKQQALFLEETIVNVNTNLTKTKNQQYKKVIG